MREASAPGQRPQPRIRAAVVDENDIFRRGLVACLDNDEDVRVVFDAPSGPVPVVADVVIVSRRTVVSVGGEGPVVICTDSPRAARIAAQRAVALLPRRMLTEQQIIAAVRAAASGLLVVASEPVGIRRAPGAMPEREIAVLRLLAGGSDTREISVTLGYSERTVKSAIQSVERRLDASNRAHAVAKAIRLGII